MVLLEDFAYRESKNTALVPSTPDNPQNMLRCLCFVFIDCFASVSLGTGDKSWLWHDNTML